MLIALGHEALENAILRQQKTLRHQLRRPWTETAMDTISMCSGIAAIDRDIMFIIIVFILDLIRIVLILL